MGSRRQLWCDLRDDAPALIFEQLAKYDPNLPFEPWCRTVLQNKFRDRLRRHQSQPGLAAVGAGSACEKTSPVEAVADPCAQEFQQRLEQALDRCAPFSARDVAAIERWPVQDRLVLLSVFFLWTKAPPAQWSDWLAEAGVEGPFPPENWRCLATDKERLEILAEELGRSFQAVKRSLHRNWRRLLKLDYVREIAS